MDERLIVCIILLISSIFLLSMYKRCQYPVLTFLGTALVGIIAHIIVFYTSQFTGVSIPLNPYTIAFSTILSIPGVILMLVLAFV